MLRPVRSTFKRRPRKRQVSRSFRASPELDKALDKAAAAKGWTKSFLIKEILTQWLTYQRIEERVR